MPSTRPRCACPALSQQIGEDRRLGVLQVAGWHQIEALKLANVGLALITLVLVHQLAETPRQGRLAVLLLAACGLLQAQPYPSKPIKIVVPFAPGGGTDVVARTLAQEMAKELGASVIIENKPGAGTILGTQMVAASAPVAAG